MQNPDNRFKVTPRQIAGQKTYVHIGAPVHGPITPDEALNWAAWLIHCAAPHTKTKVADLLKAIRK